ncbi:MerR family transcriptional regulator [Streptomyces sp. NPDC051366]|uniref:MerR family transcriptional regulator n=1 Tax=Streptomyces sp. NPDC051366 TaxID=3365652 RepID=UPI0037905563
MRVSELAQRTGASPRVLRHYDANGLLPSQRLANGYRDFPEHAIERVRRIRLLLGIGLNLKDVALLLPCFAENGNLTPCDRAQERLLGQIADIDTRMSALRATRRMLVKELRQWDRDVRISPHTSRA